MGFLTDQEIKERIDSPDNLNNRIPSEVPANFPPSSLEVHKISRGRPEGSKDSPIEIRKLATALVAAGETQKSVGESLGFPQQTVSLFSKGRTSNGVLNSELQEVITKVKRRKIDAESKAIELLIDSMSGLEEQIPNVKKATDLSKIARNLSSIARDMSGNDNEGDKSQQVHLHLYAPKQNKVEDYDTIDI